MCLFIYVFLCRGCGCDFLVVYVEERGTRGRMFCRAEVVIGVRRVGIFGVGELEDFLWAWIWMIFFYC